jgi:chromosome segregation ATPase
VTTSPQEPTFERELAAFAEDRLAFRKVTEALEAQGRAAVALRAWMDQTRSEVEELTSRGDDILSRVTAEVEALPQTLESRVQAMFDRARVTMEQHVDAHESDLVQRREALEASIRELQEEQRRTLAGMRADFAALKDQLSPHLQRLGAMEQQVRALENLGRDLMEIDSAVRGASLRGWIAAGIGGLGVLLAIALR